MFRIRYVLLFASLFCFSFLCAQDTSLTSEKSIALRGFFTGLGYARFNGNLEQIDGTALIHNRLITEGKLSKKMGFRMDLRTRMYYGDDLRSIPSFTTYLRNANEGFDLQKVWLQSGYVIAHSNIDRIYIDNTMGKWKLRSGRQRINWGIATLWNPNDVFNSYQFLDFDYEERPGVDAVKISHAAADLSEFEMAVAKLSGDEYALASRYFFNRKGYDMQFNLGVYRHRPSAGWGWAGGLGKQGFKGELQYFFKGRDHPEVFNAIVELDRIFKKERYFLFSIMYNSLGRTQAVNDPTEIGFQASPEQMMPGRWNFSGIFSKKWTPLFGGSISAIYSPGIDLLILLPRLTYSLTENTAMDLVVQSFSLRYRDRFAAWQHVLFLRVKYNF